ncbi:hypothetical protein A2I97_19590 [Bacillus velezensis]|nr:hypothetical protein A2I97_19590 [Bacillus velezensis]
MMLILCLNKKRVKKSLGHTPLFGLFFLQCKKDTFHMAPDQHSAPKHDKCHIRGMMAATTTASGAPLYLRS